VEPDSGAIALVLLNQLGPRAAQLDWQRLYDHTVAALWDALPDEHPRTSLRVTDLNGFNDHPGTAHEDVIELIDRALGSLTS
jgi:Fe-S-cluster formation regulator IscX/YfhJ